MSATVVGGVDSAIDATFDEASVGGPAKLLSGDSDIAAADATQQVSNHTPHAYKMQCTLVEARDVLGEQGGRGKGKERIVLQ